MGLSGAGGGGCPFGGADTPVVSRRRLLAGAAGLAALPALGGFGARAAAAQPAGSRAARRAARGSHAVGDPRGIRIARLGRDREARFGLMFKRLPPFAPDDALLRDLAAAMNDRKAPLTDVRDSDAAFDNPDVPAGYIYLGQFVDHDMTLDRTPLGGQQADPDATRNFESPRFDLSCVYGRGPSVNPELYDPAVAGALAVNAHDGLVDLPRDGTGAAFVGDPRNDENLIVAQLHAVFLRLHNTFLAQGRTFAQAQQLTRWHYQWVIVNDFLPRIVGQDVVSSLLRRRAGGRIEFTGTLYRPRDRNRPYMPIEYSGAAYRFGHSMIRAEYEMQDARTVPIFAPDGQADLRGSRPVPADLWADWNYFFDIPGVSAPDDRNMARLIDTQLSLPLASLPSTVVAPVTGAIVALAERNLLRGKQLGLPSGQDVAAAMQVAPLSNDELGLTDPRWGGRAPLWFYVLKEAELLGGRRLGPVGGRIVAEVILGLMALDPTSYFNAGRAFTPATVPFRMGELIVLAGAFDERGRTPPEDDEVGLPEVEPVG